MPLTRLQRLPSGTDEFIYGVSWTLSETEERKASLQRELRAVQRGESSKFDNRIEMKPGVVSTLAVSRRLYALQPEDARLWFAPGEFRDWRHEQVESRISAAEQRLSAA